MRSSEVARLAGISTDTLRHYERKEIIDLPRRSPNGYREYPSGIVERVLLVRGALRLGFSLDELADILRIRDRGGVPCREVRSLAASKLDQINEQIKLLTGLQRELRDLLNSWDEVLAATPRNRQAGLLTMLAEKSGDADRAPIRSLTRGRRTKGR